MPSCASNCASAILKRVLQNGQYVVPGISALASRQARPAVLENRGVQVEPLLVDIRHVLRLFLEYAGQHDLSALPGRVRQQRREHAQRVGRKGRDEEMREGRGRV